MCLLSGAGPCLTASAEVLDRPGGIKIGERMTLRPYLSLSMTYDSNLRASNDGDSGSCNWTISPGLSLSYDAENWSLLLTAYYSFHQYLESEDSDFDSHSFGEDLRWNWANSTGAEKGWSLVLGESFQQYMRADSMMIGDREYNADTRQWQLSGAVQRRFNECWHGDFNADYYWLDYMNDDREAGSYYGWDRWRAGLEAGYAPSRWTDFIVSGAYQGYSQDNAEGSQTIDDSSTGMSLQGGLASYMTEIH